MKMIYIFCKDSAKKQVDDICREINETQIETMTHPLSKKGEGKITHWGCGWNVTEEEDALLRERLLKLNGWVFNKVWILDGRQYHCFRHAKENFMRMKSVGPKEPQ